MEFLFRSCGATIDLTLNSLKPESSLVLFALSENMFKEKHMKIIRKSIALFLFAIIFAGFGLVQSSVSFAVEVKSDIPQVFITTKEDIKKEAYISAEITIVDSKTGSFDTIHDDSARIKIRGNSTAILAKKPFNIKLSTEKSVLGMPAGKKWSMLANYLDTSLMRNKLSYDFAKDIGLDYSCESRYVDVWVNGEYNGNYLITVPVEVGKNRVDIDIENGDYLLELSVGRVEEGVTYLNTYVHRFELNDPETLTDEQTAWLFAYLVEAENAMKSAEFNNIKKYVDVDSFVDFFIVQELFKNIDVNTSSTRYYIKDKILYAGPLWDMDLIAGNVSKHNVFSHYNKYNNWGEYGNKSGNSCEGLWALNQEMDGPNSTIGPSWIGYLMKCSEFRSLVYKRYLELQDQIVNLYKDNLLGKNRMDILLDSYGKSFARDVQKWPTDVYRNELYRIEEKTFDDSVSFLKDFLKKRNDWLLANMIPKDFTPAPTPIITKTAASTNATVYVDGSNISFDAYNIEGNNYFKLRDLAMAIRGSNKQFEVEWNEGLKAINLISNKSYTPAGGELAAGIKGKVQSSLWTSDIFKDNAKVELMAYNIKGNNYFKLRDVAELFDIGVGWNPDTQTIEIDTEISYTEP